MSLFGKKDFFEIADPDEQFRALLKRKYWSDIRPEILRQISESAKSSPISFAEFVMLSEQFNLVKDQYQFASKMERDDDTLGSISFTLFSLADSLIKQFEKEPTAQDASMWPLIAVALAGC